MTIERETFTEVMTSFPTGVAVITTLDAEGCPWGLTTNAVASVSAEPPMLLVCVAKTSRTLPALLERKGFLVNFMAVGSDAVCATFASKRDAAAKFAATSWQPSAAGHPILSADAVAYADCTTVEEMEAGSHLILVGAVETGAVIDRERDPIAYFRRAYKSWPAS